LKADVSDTCEGCSGQQQDQSRRSLSLYARPRESPFIRGDEGTVIVSTYAEIRVATKG
jgi:hypothetical protein